MFIVRGVIRGLMGPRTLLKDGGQQVTIPLISLYSSISLVENIDTSKHIHRQPRSHHQVHLK